MNCRDAQSPTFPTTRFDPALGAPQRSILATTGARGGQIAFAFALSIGISGLVGCKTSSPSQYVSPRVTGRVLDSQTGEPIKAVNVQRLVPGRIIDPGVSTKGGSQSLAIVPTVRTGEDGIFVLRGEREVAFFRTLGWTSVGVSFERRGYERWVTNFTRTNSITTPEGEPVVQAGDIRLQPKAR